jgi:hypothetical protein
MLWHDPIHTSRLVCAAIAINGIPPGRANTSSSLTTWLSHSKKKTCDVCKHPYSFTKGKVSLVSPFCAQPDARLQYTRTICPNIYLSYSYYANPPNRWPLQFSFVFALSLCPSSGSPSYLGLLFGLGECTSQWAILRMWLVIPYAVHSLTYFVARGG